LLMLKKLIILSIALVFVSLFLRQHNSIFDNTVSKNLKSNVAIIGNSTITAAQLDEASKKRLQKVREEIYRIKKHILENMIDNRLIKLAAKKAGKSPDEYIKSKINARSVQPTENEIKAFYDANAKDINSPIGNIHDRIALHIMRGRIASARQDLIRRLRKTTKVKIMLQAPRIDLDTEDETIYGKKDAKIKIIEFSDYLSPLSKRERHTLWNILKKYKNNIQYVYLDFPASKNGYAKIVHEAARCAGKQNAYYPYNKILYKNQKHLELADLKSYANTLKLNMTQFNKCLNEHKTANEVEKNIREGINAGVIATPTFFINGIMIIGTPNASRFSKIIDKELNK